MTEKKQILKHHLKTMKSSLHFQLKHLKTILLNQVVLLMIKRGYSCYTIINKG
jgi:hypothetical protein